MSTNEAVTLTRDEVHLLVRELKAEMVKPAFVESVRAAAVIEPLPTTQLELLLRYEKKQVEFLDAYINEKLQENEVCEGRRTTLAALGGAGILEDLKRAAKGYPDSDTTSLIKEMCMLEELQLMKIAGTTPELRALVGQNNCNDSSHGHSHGHGHGHCHCHKPSQEQLAMMQMALQSLTPAMRTEMENIQRSMMSGQRPTPEQLGKMREIQMRAMAFMNTMKRFGGGAGAAGSGAESRPQSD